jgi:thiosulfate dehydrogenase
MPEAREPNVKRRSLGRRLVYGVAGALVLAGGSLLLMQWVPLEPSIGVEEAIEAARPLQKAARQAREHFEAEREARRKSDAPPVEAPVAGMPVGEDGIFVPRPLADVPDNPFGQSVLRGREIFVNTNTNAGEFVGNDLACTNCHLDDGRRPNSAPMWAAALSYPMYRGKNERINIMTDRIIGCFTYSINAQGSPSGGPPPRGHQVLKDLQSYFFFLADGAPLNQKVQGIGYPKVPETENGYDWRRGEKVFAENCAVCHGKNGQGRRDLNGKVIFPALWGPGSYNWGAGMHRIPTATAFIKANMPFGRPNSLTDQEAWDVAAFVNSHERPPDPRAEGMSIAEAEERYHQKPDYYGHVIRGELLDGIPNTSQDSLTGDEERSTEQERRGAVGGDDG